LLIVLFVLLTVAAVVFGIFVLRALGGDDPGTGAGVRIVASVGAASTPVIDNEVVR
jgi:hypothetical protein